jgi:hypothetical protein
VHLYKPQDLRVGGRPQQRRQLDEKEATIMSSCRACSRLEKGQNAAYVVHENEEGHFLRILKHCRNPGEARGKEQAIGAAPLSSC